ncbi:hypothetical protein HZB02_06360 [Candidatus Woesearchaeota archaeon]|nr:hypothetical protein [Candidatus Woesearchaeota archaeon]
MGMKSEEYVQQHGLKGCITAVAASAALIAALFFAGDQLNKRAEPLVQQYIATQRTMRLQEKKQLYFEEQFNVESAQKKHADRVYLRTDELCYDDFFTGRSCISSSLVTFDYNVGLYYLRKLE